MDSDTPKTDESPVNEVTIETDAVTTTDNIIVETHQRIDDAISQSTSDENDTEYEKECNDAVDAIASVLNHDDVNTDLENNDNISEATCELPSDTNNRTEELGVSVSPEIETLDIPYTSDNDTLGICKSPEKEVQKPQTPDNTNEINGRQEDALQVESVDIVANNEDAESSYNDTETNTDGIKHEALEDDTFKAQSLTPETCQADSSDNIPSTVTPDELKVTDITEQSQTSEVSNDSIQVPNENGNDTTYQPVFSYDANGMDYMVSEVPVTQPSASMEQAFIDPAPPNYFQHHNVQMDQSATVGINYQTGVAQNQTTDVSDPYRSESTDSGKSEANQDQASSQNTNTAWNYYPQATQNMPTEYAQYAHFAEYQKQYQQAGSSQDYSQAQNQIAEPPRSQVDPMLPRVTDAEDIATYVAQQAYMANVGGAVASMIPVKYDATQVMSDSVAVPGPAETRTDAMTSQPVRRKQKKVVVPADPMKWTAHHVKEWLDWSILEHSLHDVIDKEKFPSINGRELCQMSRDGFAKVIGQYEAADKLLQHIEHLRESYTASIDGNSNDTSSPATHPGNSYMHASGGSCVTKTGTTPSMYLTNIARPIFASKP